MDSSLNQPPVPSRRHLAPQLSWRQREYRMWVVFAPLGILFLFAASYQAGLFSHIPHLGNSPADETAEPKKIDTRLLPGTADIDPHVPPEALVTPHARADDKASQAMNFSEFASLDFTIVRQDAGFLPEERKLWASVLNALAKTSDVDLSRDTLGIVQFSQLYRQAETYCGKVITVRGELKRVETGKPFLLDNQWTPLFRCWVRPEFANDPLALDVLYLPQQLTNLIGQELKAAPQFTIQATGVFLKRLAYRSQSGPRVAPLLLCKTLIATPFATASPDGGLGWLPATIASAALLAGLAMFWITWRTRRFPRKGRGIPLLIICAAILNSVAAMTLAQNTLTEDAARKAPIASAHNDTTLDDYLQLLDFTDEDWRRLRSWGPASVENLPSIGKVADLLDRIPLQDVATWSQSAPAVASILKPGDKNHGSVMRWTGAVTRLRPHRRHPTNRSEAYEDDPEGVESQGILWECILDSPTRPGLPLTCFVRRVPSSWRHAALADHPIEATIANESERTDSGWCYLHEQTTIEGLFLPSSVDLDKSQQSLLIAPRIQWYPRLPNPQMKITQTHCLLASAGFDVALLESVTQRGPLNAGDREPFYQLLAFIPQIDPRRLKSAGDPTVPLSRLLQDDGRFRGEVFSFEGTARRAIEVRVDAPDIQERFGIRRYFEVEVFVEPDVQIQVVHPETGEAKAFRRYPLVFCCRDWPAQAPTGDVIHVPVSITGVYLKQWTYRSKFMDEGWSDGTERVQWSPLLIAADATILPPPVIENDPLSILTGTILVVSIALVAGSAIWMAFGSRRTLLPRSRGRK